MTRLGAISQASTTNSAEEEMTENDNAQEPAVDMKCSQDEMSELNDVYSESGQDSHNDETIDDGPRRLRALVQCRRCPMKFSNASRLELHQKSDHLENEEDGDAEAESSSSDGAYDDDTSCTSDDKDGPPQLKKIKREVEWECAQRSGDDEYHLDDNHEPESSEHDDLETDKKYDSNKDNPVLFRQHSLSVGTMKLEGIPEGEGKCWDKLRCKYESCSGLKFNFPAELENHSKFHAEFPCEKCDRIKDFAGDFALHQLDHSPPLHKRKQRISKYFCWKCGRWFPIRGTFVNHFLRVHMRQLGGDHNRCLICRKRFCGAYPIPVRHYAIHHDLNRLKMSSKPFYCNKGRCRAYFLLERQRNRHRLKDAHMGNVKRVKMKIKREGRALPPSWVIGKCPECPRRGSNPWLKLHIALCHPKDGTGRVAKVGQKVITAQGLSMTLADWVKRKGASHKCHVEGCQRAYFTEFELKIHSKVHGNFACEACKENFTCAIQLANHELEHCSVVPAVQEISRNAREMFQCPRCPTFRKESNERYVCHFLKKHLGLEMDCVRCPVCMAPLLGLRNLTSEMLKHFVHQHGLGSGEPSEGKVEKCEQCPAYFLNRSQLDNHMTEIHGGQGKVYPCSSCGRHFSHIKYLRAHRKRGKMGCRLSEKDFQFTCTSSSTNCGRKFETRTELEKHLSICRNYPPLVCSQCGLKCFGHGGLAIHMRAHDEEGLKKKRQVRSHVCEICGKAFIRSNTLKKHRVIHEDPTSWSFKARHRKGPEQEESGNDCNKPNPDLSDPHNVTVGEMKLEGIPENQQNYSHHHNLRCGYESCATLKFNFPVELEKHSKFHGELKCEKCDTVKDFAGDFALHQMEHSPTEKQNQSINIVCWKCGRGLTNETIFVCHFITVHMENLSSQHNRCLICHEKFCGAFPIPASHYAIQHDLNRLKDPSSKPFYCGKGRCTAYFVEERLRNLHHKYGTHKMRRNCEMLSGFGENTSGKVLPPSWTVVKCPKCPKMLTTQSLKYHMAVRHSNDMNETAGVKLGEKLITANGTTKSIQDWVSRRTGASHKCSVDNCTQAYFSDFELQVHSKMHGDFECTICEEKFEFAPKLASHELEHSESTAVALDEQEGGRIERCLKCPRCPFKLNRRRPAFNLQHFLKKHLGLAMDCVRCPICMAPLLGYVDRPEKLMLRHFLDHHDLSQVPTDKNVEKCEQCPAHFLNKMQLDNHVKEIHTDYAGGYPCSNCGRTFSKMEYLRLHRRVGNIQCRFIEQDFQYTCRRNVHCGRKFETELELERHEFVCDNFPLQMCPQCGKRLRGHLGLQAHMKTHVQSRKHHVCDICGRVLKDSTAFKNHLLFHQDPESWQFSCATCAKKCATKQKLTQHMRTHTKEKLYVCQTCGVKYAHLHNLRNHRRTKHGIDEQVRKIADTSNYASSRKGKRLKKRVETDSSSEDGDGAM